MERVSKSIPRPLRPQPLFLAATCLLLAGALAQPVAAQTDPTAAPSDGLSTTFLDDARKIVVGASVSGDSNFFRLPDVPAGTPSETISTAYARLRIDKPYAQQRFFVEAAVTAYRYQRFSYLDFDGFDYRAAWYWHLTPRLSGTLSADRTQTPTQFQDTIGIRSNVTTTETYAFTLDGQLFGGWHALLGAAQSIRTSEQSLLQGIPDYRESSGEAGIRYAFASGSDVIAVQRRVDGTQDSQVVNNVVVVNTENYSEDQSELRGTWNASASSVLTGRVTYYDRRYDVFTQNNFSGTGGSLGYTWIPTGKLRVLLAATRSISPWQSLFANYRVSNELSITPTWQVAPRTTVYMSVGRRYDDFPQQSLAAVSPERSDATTNAILGVNWFPTRTLAVNLGVEYHERTSNELLMEYATNIARLSISLGF